MRRRTMLTGVGGTGIMLLSGCAQPNNSPSDDSFSDDTPPNDSSSSENEATTDNETETQESNQDLTLEVTGQSSNKVRTITKFTITNNTSKRLLTIPIDDSKYSIVNLPAKTSRKYTTAFDQKPNVVTPYGRGIIERATFENASTDGEYDVRAERVSPGKFEFLYRDYDYLRIDLPESYGVDDIKNVKMSEIQAEEYNQYYELANNIEVRESGIYFEFYELGIPASKLRFAITLVTLSEETTIKVGPIETSAAIEDATISPVVEETGSGAKVKEVSVSANGNMSLSGAEPKVTVTKIGVPASYVSYNTTRGIMENSVGNDIFNDPTTMGDAIFNPIEEEGTVEMDYDLRAPISEDAKLSVLIGSKQRPITYIDDTQPLIEYL